MNSRLPLYSFLAALLVYVAGWFIYNGKLPDFGSAGDSAQIAQESPERLARIRAMAETWPKQPSYRDSFNALDPSAKKEEAENASDAASTTADLPAVENGAHELVAGYCSGCHSLDIVRQQHASPARWKELLIWMEEKQGMPPLPKEDETKVLEYLSANFGAAG